MRDSRWQWALLWSLCAIGWIIAIVYVIADIRETTIDLF